MHACAPFLPGVPRTACGSRQLAHALRLLALAACSQSFLDDMELKRMFETYGPVTSAVIQRTDVGRSKGFGFVEFLRTEHAEQ